MPPASLHRHTTPATVSRMKVIETFSFLIASKMEVDRKLSHNPSSYSIKIIFCTDFRADTLTCQIIKDFKADISLCLACTFLAISVCPRTLSQSSLPASKKTYIFYRVLSENKGIQCLSDFLFTLTYHHYVRSVNIFHMLAKAVPPFQHLQDLST